MCDIFKNTFDTIWEHRHIRIAYYNLYFDAVYYYYPAKGANNAKGFVATLDGNYAQAAQSYGSTVSNNAALAQILAKDYSKATTTLNAVAQPDATTDYLKAIVGARTNDAGQVTSNLKKAISKDSSLAEKALNDEEFAQFVRDSAFLQAIGR